ncbi:hypothetical protein AYO44_02525 [Planctomycetaceae bacterium SCGC AG-212-F19]|nr:hypothetical protein AYO44_02525 [Planctomycetaceae bacterium SCGC AG-212-F19]
MAGSGKAARRGSWMGADKPMLLIIPAGVAHAYRNVGSEEGILFNCPNRLYRDRERRSPSTRFVTKRTRERRFSWTERPARVSSAPLWRLPQ